MFSMVKSFFNNKSKDLELREKELYLRQKELEIREKELNIKENYNEKNETPIIKEKKEELIKKVKKEFTEDEKKAYAQRMKDLKEKGKEYEEFVAGRYKLEGYDIYLHGIKKGLKDKGIDIICTKNEELILIQCKNWEKHSSYKINSVIRCSIIRNTTNIPTCSTINYSITIKINPSSTSINWCCSTCI